MLLTRLENFLKANLSPAEMNDFWFIYDDIIAYLSDSKTPQDKFTLNMAELFLSIERKERPEIFE